MDMIIVDYLQLMQGPRGVESRQQEIATISRSMKALAKELNIPIGYCHGDLTFSNFFSFLLFNLMIY